MEGQHMRTAFIAAVWAAAAVSSQAGSIAFTGTNVDLGGTGFGNVLNVLSVAHKGTEYGSVTWNGSADVLGGDATNSSKTQSVASMQASGIGGTNFAVYFNGNEPGNAPGVTLHDFTLHFLDSAGLSLFDVAYTAPVGGLNISDFGGTGQAGWLFQVMLSGAEQALFYGNTANRLGMSIASGQEIELTAGGAENFFLGPIRTDPGPGGQSTPEPASLAVWGVLAVGLVAAAKRRQSAI